MRRLSIGFLTVTILAACGRDGGGALEQPDPLHDQGIHFPAEPPAMPPRPGPLSIQEAELEPVEWNFFIEGIFPCSRCHVGGPEVRDSLPAMPHRTHLDRELECADCHMPDDEEADPAVPKAEICFDCHEDLGDESEAVRAYFDRARQADGSYVFPRRWQSPDLIFSHKKHRAAEIECKECHGEASNEAFVKPKSVPLMQSCIDCHRERSAPAECKTCHKEEYEPRHGIVLHHAENQRGCLDCHNPDDRDTLRLANGDTVSFARSYRLCGQCHGPKLRDWKLGLHGKRTMVAGHKQYYLCAHCHNPHQPAFAPMTPDAPPVRPEDIR